MNTGPFASLRRFRTGISTLLLKKRQAAHTTTKCNPASPLDAAPHSVHIGEHPMNIGPFASLQHFPTGISTLMLKRSREP